MEEGTVLSIINYRDFLTMLPALVNDGKGRNYGIEITLERYLHKGYYYLFTGSLFNSRYTGGDGVWRNTVFNRNFIFNALGGKEWKMGRQNQNILGISLRFTMQGGERYIPFDMEASKATQTVVFDDLRTFDPQLSPDFVCHFTVSYKINRNRLSHEISLKMINVTGNQELGAYYYDYRKNEPVMYMGAVSIPNISYKIEF